MNAASPPKDLNSRKSSFDQRWRQQSKIDDEQISEQKRRPMRDRLEAKQIKRREHRDRRETDRAREKCGVCFIGARCPRGRGQEQRLKPNKHRHEDEHSVAGEIFLRNKERADPGKLHQCRSNRAQDRERIPTLPLRQCEQTDVEQRDVTEKSERIILVRREQDGREKSARYPEHRDDDSVQAHGKQKRDCCDQRHQQKRWNETKEREVIVSSTCKGHGVKHQDAGRAERLRSDSVFFPFQEQTANNKSGADDESDRNPQLRRCQIVLERIFHEECDAEEKREPADPREQFRAHELLPINRRFGWSSDLRRARFEELLWDWQRLWHGLGYGGSRYHRWCRRWNGFHSWLGRQRRGLGLHGRILFWAQIMQFVFEG
jgi:hypothetical protein